MSNQNVIDFEDIRIDSKSILDRASRIVEDHPVIVSTAAVAISIFIGYKCVELPIKNAIFKANKQTIDYMLSQVRFVR